MVASTVPTNNTAAESGESEVVPTVTAKRVEVDAQRFRHIPDTTQVGFVWGESCCGQKKDGPQTAPAKTCNKAFLDVVRALGWKPSIIRAPQIFVPTAGEACCGPCYQPHTVLATCHSVREKCNEVRRGGGFPLLIGGDHCLAMGSITSSLEAFPNVGVLWFDAHADINTPDTSPSGNMHGMPLAALMNLPGTGRIPGFEHDFPILRPERVAYIGLRDVDEGEREIIEQLGISCAFTMDDIKAHGIRRLTELALKKLCPNGDEPVHISFDVDGMDPIDAPSTGTPVGDGVRLHEALEMVSIVRSTGNLVGFDCVEINPSIGTEAEVRITIANAQLIMAHVLGRAEN